MILIHSCPACGAMFTGREHQCLTRYPGTGLARQPDSEAAP